jgi:hypothetical protein
LDLESVHEKRAILGAVLLIGAREPEEIRGQATVGINILEEVVLFGIAECKVVDLVPNFGEKTQEWERVVGWRIA